MSLLTTVQSAADLVGIPRPTTVVSSTDQQVRQLYSIANEAGTTLASDPNLGWQILITEDTFLTTAAATQAGAVPSDWGSFVHDSMWNRSQSRQVWGPISPQDWQMILANGPIGVIDSYFRLRGGLFMLTPAPPAGQTIAYEYISLNWCANNLLVPQSSYTADNDVARISERLIKLRMVWMFKQAKGLDYAEDMTTYEREYGKYISKDKGLQTLSLSRPSMGLHGPYVPDGNFPP